MRLYDRTSNDVVSRYHCGRISRRTLLNWVLQALKRPGTGPEISSGGNEKGQKEQQSTVKGHRVFQADVRACGSASVAQRQGQIEL